MLLELTTIDATGQEEKILIRANNIEQLKRAVLHPFKASLKVYKPKEKK